MKFEVLKYVIVYCKAQKQSNNETAIRIKRKNNMKAEYYKYSQDKDEYQSI